jgi:predicted acetyltransferase
MSIIWRSIQLLFIVCHIGYGILPEHRRRGYGTESLRQGVGVARNLGIARVLLTTDETNVGSRMVIERCGGRHEPTVGDVQLGIKRYWIDV